MKYQQRQFENELELLEKEIDFEIKQIDDTMKYYEQQAERNDEEFKKRLEKMSEEYDKEWEIRKKYMSKEENLNEHDCYYGCCFWSDLPVDERSGVGLQGAVERMAGGQAGRD